jgi:hypothetical protein
MSIHEYDSNFIRHVGAASKKQAETPAAPADETAPTFQYRRKLANICEATIIRVVELEDEAKRLTEIAKKLRAAVVANT